MGGPKRPDLPKICHTYPAMMKLGSYTLPKEDPKKYMNHVTQRLSSADVAFFTGNQQILLYQEIHYILHV